MGYVTSGQPLQSVKTGMASALQPLVLGRRPVVRWIDHLLPYAPRTKKVASLAPRLSFISTKPGEKWVKSDAVPSTTTLQSLQ